MGSQNSFAIMTPPINDQELIRMILSEETKLIDQAVSIMWEKYHDLVANLVGKWGGIDLDKVSILHDSLLALIDKIQNGTYDSKRASLKTLFNKIARNKCIDHFEKKKKNSISEFDENYHNPDRNKISPAEENLISKEDRQKMLQALKQLNPECRDLFFMKYNQGITLRYIGEILGISEAAVKKRHERCKKKLKSLFPQDPRI